MFQAYRYRLLIQWKKRTRKICNSNQGRIMKIQKEGPVIYAPPTNENFTF